MLLAWIKRIPDMVEQTHYLQLLSRMVNVDENILRKAITRSAAQAERAPTSESISPSSTDSSKTVLEKTGIRLAALILRTGDIRGNIAKIELDWLPNEALKKLYKSLEFFYDIQVQQARDKWLSDLPDEIQSLGREVLLLTDEIDDETTPQELIAERESLVARLKDICTKRELQGLRERIQDAEAKGDQEALQELLKEWQRLQMSLRGATQSSVPRAKDGDPSDILGAGSAI